MSTSFYTWLSQINFNFSAILFFLTIATGFIYCLDKIFLRKKRVAVGVPLIEKENIPQEPALIKISRSLFSVFLIVFLLRSFLVEPFRIPSGSMIPSLLIGDFILVNKYAYGVRLPVTNKKIFNVSEPQSGDVMVFRYPVNPSVNFIKRVIGVPGDTIKYVNKKLYVNNKQVPEQLLRIDSEYDNVGMNAYGIQKYKVYKESLKNNQHLIQERINDNFALSIPVFTIKVPKGQYFVLGDNRDNSEDSRYWGFVPEENIVGKAFAIWLSWDQKNWRLRWDHAPSWIR